MEKEEIEKLKKRKSQLDEEILQLEENQKKDDKIVKKFLTVVE